MKNGRYRPRFRDLDGRLRSLPGRLTFASKRKALDAARDHERRVRRGEAFEESCDIVTLRDLYERFVDGARQRGRPGAARLARYASTWRAHVEPQFGSRKFIGLNRGELQDLVDSVAGEGKLYEAHEVAKLLSRLFNEARKRELLPPTRGNPASRLEKPPLPSTTPEVLSPDEVCQLAEAVPAMYRALIYVRAYASLRWSEAIALRVQDIDFLRAPLPAVSVRGRVSEVDGKIVDDGRTGLTKTPSSVRTVEIPRWVADELARHVERFPPAPDGRIFYALKNGAKFAPMRRSNFYRYAWWPALKAIGREGFPSMNLRHTGATLFLDAGGDVFDLRDRLGHTTARMSERYVGRRRSVADVVRRMGEMGREAEGRGASATPPRRNSRGQRGT